MYRPRSWHPSPARQASDSPMDTRSATGIPTAPPGATTFPDHRSAEKFVSLIDALGVADALERVGRTAPQPVVPTSPTVAATLERYAATRPSLDTANKYRIIARRTINPVLGEILISELMVDDVQSWLNGLTIAGRSIQQAHMVLKASLSAAIDRGELAINPARKASRSGSSGVRLPRRQPGKQAVFLSLEETALGASSRARAASRADRVPVGYRMPHRRGPGAHPCRHWFWDSDVQQVLQQTGRRIR